MTDQVVRINYLIRCPQIFAGGECYTYRISIELYLICKIDKTGLPELVCNSIIPAIAMLRQKYRLTMSTIFQYKLNPINGLPIDNGLLLLSDRIEVGDLFRSDEFFNSITYK